MVTPQTEAPKIASLLGIDKLFLKREDLHPYGSHKGRSIPTMIDQKIAEGEKDFVISSSGNAALAAIRHIQKLKDKNLSLSVILGEHINEAKRKMLQDEIHDSRIKIEESPRPLQALFKLVKDSGKVSLRQSTDDTALLGYESLAEEISNTPGLGTIFIAASSGTAAEALANYFIKKGKPVAVHIVQTSSIHPIAGEFTKPDSDEISSADAIVDKIAHRKDALVDAIRKTKGRGWIASNVDINRAQKLLKEKADIEATANGALGLAGLIHATDKGEKFKGSVVCIITGK